MYLKEEAMFGRLFHVHRQDNCTKKLLNNDVEGA